MELKPGSEIIFDYKTDNIYIVYGYNFDKSKICIFKKNFKNQNVYENLIYVNSNVIEEFVKCIHENNDSNYSNDCNQNNNQNNNNNNNQYIFLENIKNIINKIKLLIL